MRVAALRADGFEEQESGWLALAAAGAEQVSTRELLAIAEAAPGSLGVPDQPGLGVVGDSITQLRCIDRLSAFLAARRHTVIGALCPPEDRYRAEQHLVEELQVAARVGPGVAHRDIEAARLLAGPFARSHHDLAAGSISDAHTRVLIFETRNVGDDPTPHPDLTRAANAAGPADAAVPPRCREQKLEAIQARVAAAARRQTTSQFQVTVRAAICAVDAQGEADRRAAAKKTRDVTQTQDSDGMGILIDRDDAASVDAIHTELTRQARLLQAERGGTTAARTGDPDARIGACRADVLKTLILGRDPPAPLPTPATRRPPLLPPTTPAAATVTAAAVVTGPVVVVVSAATAPPRRVRVRTGRSLSDRAGTRPGRSPGHRPGHPARRSRAPLPARRLRDPGPDGT